MDGFEVCMAAQRDRARAASKFAIAGLDFQSQASTEFLGYFEHGAEATIKEIFVEGESVTELKAGQAAWIVLDRTPFYGESGGQVGDIGVLSNDKGAVFEVMDTQKQRKAFAHAGSLGGEALYVGDTVKASINVERRLIIRQHHSATHLLHGALRSVLGTHVEQKGSLVNDSNLRFDFSHGEPVTDEQIVQIERWIDDEVRANSPCITEEMSMDEAVAAGAMALFGEKYGDVVRVVRLGDKSIELCGGIHVTATGELGSVKVVGEGGVAAGVRRIEAVSGHMALQHSQRIEKQLNDVATTLKAPKTDVLPKLKQLQARNKELTKQVEQLQDKLASSAGKDIAASAEKIGPAQVLFEVIDDADAKSLRSMMDQLRQQLAGSAIVLASENAGKASLIATVDDSLHASVMASDLLKQVTVVLGGRGGGRADMAQGGADSLQNIDQAFDAARAWITTQLS
jgi:alanyl-tRNA synthetase